MPRPRASTLDVVKSLEKRDNARFDTTTIDSLFGAPEKIHIPERYIPDTVRIMSLH